MALFARSFQDGLSASLEDIAQNTNLTRLSAGGKIRAILETVNKRLEEQYQLFDLNLARGFVSSAQGQFLDLFGILLGIERAVSESASASDDLENIKFYVDSGTFGSVNNGNDILIPQGTLISSLPNNTGTLYRISESIILPASSSSQFVTAEANSPGAASNIGSGSLIYHSFNGYTDYLNKTLKITNLHAIANGKNFESDANYRFRIINRVLESEAANKTAIRLAALSTPGVADIILVPFYRGIGTFGVFIQSITPTVSQTLIDAVTANVENVIAFGEKAYVKKPRELGLSFNITVYYANTLPDNELDEIEQSMQDIIISYVNNLDLGQEFIVNKIIADLYAVSGNIINFGQPGIPIDEVFLYYPTRLEDSKTKQKLLGDYYPKTDERIIIEPSIINPIVFNRKFGRRR